MSEFNTPTEDTSKKKSIAEIMGAGHEVAETPEQQAEAFAHEIGGEAVADVVELEKGAFFDSAELALIQAGSDEMLRQRGVMIEAVDTEPDAARRGQRNLDGAAVLEMESAFSGLGRQEETLEGVALKLGILMGSVKDPNAAYEMLKRAQQDGVLDSDALGDIDADILRRLESAQNDSESMHAAVFGLQETANSLITEGYSKNALSAADLVKVGASVGAFAQLGSLEGVDTARVRLQAVTEELYKWGR